MTVTTVKKYNLSNLTGEALKKAIVEARAYFNHFMLDSYYEGEYHWFSDKGNPMHENLKALTGLYEDYSQQWECDNYGRFSYPKSERGIIDMDILKKGYPDALDFVNRLFNKVIPCIDENRIHFYGECTIGRSYNKLPYDKFMFAVDNIVSHPYINVLGDPCIKADEYTSRTDNNGKPITTYQVTGHIRFEIKLEDAVHFVSKSDMKDYERYEKITDMVNDWTRCDMWLSKDDDLSTFIEEHDLVDYKIDEDDVDEYEEEEIILYKGKYYTEEARELIYIVENGKGITFDMFDEFCEGLAIGILETEKDMMDNTPDYQPDKHFLDYMISTLEARDEDMVFDKTGENLELIDV